MPQGNSSPYINRTMSVLLPLVLFSIDPYSFPIAGAYSLLLQTFINILIIHKINVGSHHTFTPFYSPSTPFQGQFFWIFLQFLITILSIKLIFCAFCVSSTLYSPSAQQMFLLQMVVQFIPHYTSKKDTLKADMLLVYNLKQHFHFLCL